MAARCMGCFISRRALVHIHPAAHARISGNEQNLDLAQSVRRAGWNVLTFHYRGSWGSEGAFSFGHALEDADSAIAFLRDLAHAKQYR